MSGASSVKLHFEDQSSIPIIPAAPAGVGAGAGSVPSSSSSSQPASVGVNVAVEKTPLLRRVTNVNYSVPPPPSASTSLSSPPITVSTSGEDNGNGRRRSACGRSVRVPATSRFLLDLHLPPEGTTNELVPVLVHVHGGGWQRGDKGSEWRGAPTMGRTASQNGMVVACIQYRLARPTVTAHIFRGVLLTTILTLIIGWTPFFRGQWDRLGIFMACSFVVIALGGWIRTYLNHDLVQHPHQVQDVARAIAWIKDHLKTYYPAADLNRVFLSGHSAGGHLATLVAVDQQYLRQYDIPTSFIKGVVSISGIYQVDAPLSDSYRGPRNGVFRTLYTKAAFGYSRETWIAASPMTHVNASSPPFLIMNASSDLGLEVDGQRFVTKLRTIGVPVTYEVIPATSHASIASDFHKHIGAQHFMTFVKQRCASLDTMERAALPSSSVSSMDDSKKI